MTFKVTMGVLSVLITLVAYTIYLYQTTRVHGVQPHPFSWFLWGLVTAVGFLVQVTQRAGPGSWALGLTAAICLLIGAVSLLKHRWRFSLFDWLSLAAGLIVFGYYMLSKTPTLSAILATAADVIGYGSTVKKGWAEPHKDSATSFALNSAKFVPSLLALESYSLTTCVYPLTLLLVNGAVASMLLMKRRWPSRIE